MARDTFRKAVERMMDDYELAGRLASISGQVPSGSLEKAQRGGDAILAAYDKMSARIAELEAVCEAALCYDEAYDAQAARIKELETALRLQNTQGGDEEVLSPELPAEDGTGEWKQGHWRDEKAHGSDWVQLGLWKRT